MNLPISHIVIGSSLTEASDGVLRAGLALARAVGARFTIVHGYDVPTYYYGGGVYDLGWVAPEVYEGYRSWSQEQLDAQLERLGAVDDSLAGTRAAAASAADLIVETAREREADLVVVGATERGALGRLLGSTADRVLRRAPCPVLVVREGLAVPPARVLAPVDLSNHSAEALAWTGALLDQLAGGGDPPLDVLFVLEPLPAAMRAQFAPEQMKRFAESELHRFVARVSSVAARGPRLRVRSGDPRLEITAEVEATSADLVVLCTHGHGGFTRLVVGSVAADVVAHAPCSVLVVPPGAARQAALGLEGEARTGSDGRYVSDEDSAPAAPGAPAAPDRPR